MVVPVPNSFTVYINVLVPYVHVLEFVGTAVRDTAPATRHNFVQEISRQHTVIFLTTRTRAAPHRSAGLGLVARVCVAARAGNC